jgi:hypothetical protein
MSDLQDLDTLSKRINVASDELNKALQTIQDKLNALSLGVEVWLTSESDELDEKISGSTENGRVLQTQELGYGRLGDGWGLLVRRCSYEQDFDGMHWHFRPGLPTVIDQGSLLKASRHVRVAAVTSIPLLIEKIKREATDVIKAVEGAKRIAESLK